MSSESVTEGRSGNLNFVIEESVDTLSLVCLEKGILKDTINTTHDGHQITPFCNSTLYDTVGRCDDLNMVKKKGGEGCHSLHYLLRKMPLLLSTHHIRLSSQT